jgi:phosphatidylglycerophosphate synthase
MQDLLPAPLSGKARSAPELRTVLAGIDGDVLLVSAEADCSGPYPVTDVCRPGRTAVVVGAGGSAGVRVAGGAVVSAGTSQAPLVDEQNRAVGCLHIASADRPALAQALADVPQGPPGALWEQILSVLVMRGVTVAPVEAAPFAVGQAPVTRAPDPIRLQARRCARGGDGWLSERTVRPISRRLTPVAVRLGLAPNTITVVSLLAGAGAVATALTGSRWGYAATAVLMLVSLVLDCVDGEVARWTHRYSRGGAWLDAVGDRVKEYAVWFAVAWAVAQQAFWLLVLACLVVFTAKHFLDYGWSLRHPPWQPRAVGVDATADPWYRAGAVPPVARPPSWRRILGMPIAERWLLLAVLLPVLGPWPAFIVLGSLGLVSLAYTVLTRVRWSHAPIDTAMTPRLQAITDPGPLLLALRPGRVAWGTAAVVGFAVLLAGATGPMWAILAGYTLALGLYALAYGPGPRGRLGWMSPSIARTTEMSGLLVLAWSSADIDPVAVFALLAAGAWRQYDVIYRIRHQQVLPGRPAWVALLGTEGRVLVAIALLLAFGSWTWLWFALYVAVVAVADSLWSWFRG